MEGTKKGQRVTHFSFLIKIDIFLSRFSLSIFYIKVSSFFFFFLCGVIECKCSRDGELSNNRVVASHREL